MWTKSGSAVFKLSVAVWIFSASLQTTAQNTPRLILQVTVDQLRGDLPTRFMNRFGDGGFRYLWQQGTVYTDAYHNHANNETIVGHTTLATGATPAAHGMIGNTWLDRETGWRLLKPRSSYLYGNSDDRPWEIDLAGFGSTFPHNYGSADSPYYTTLLTVSPAGDELTLDFAKAIIEHENLGADEVTDYLSISLSSTDYVGHLFGPSSLEAEENLLRVDRLLADLFIYVEENIGLDNTLIVLSADHGAPNTPGYSNSLNIPGGYVKPETWDQQAAIERLKQRFNIQTKLIEKYQHPYIYLSPEIASRNDAEREAIERAVATEVALFPEVSLAISSRALEYGNLPDTELVRAVLRNFNPKRSGDVYVVFEPNWFINDMDGLVVASTHGSPWRYDSFVPVVFAGADIRPQKIHRRIVTVDIARTLAAYLGIKPPSGSTGSILQEILQ